ncbi:HAD family hydrolase [Rubellimicrobium rubrum]|uniref:phosphoglycolate phosphatase n=1 Tax=Rubellimicrobium rubrum TaxID=2585369 RepID=A0A5C4N1A9_9RHOB|nr:HAD family hydrolase [Rubellimicrobium rubrum]TNC50094.1 HAD family hydrolase [Rubellimicrobium rubrum]
MTRIKGILFDKDGTLFDFQATWGAWSRGMIEAESGGDPALRDRIAEVLGYDLATSRFHPDSIVIASTTETVAEHLTAVLPGVDKEALMARMNDRAADAPQVEVAGLREVLDRLAGMGLSLGVATNDTEGPARSHLRAAGIEERFGFIAGFDSGWGGKPAAGQLLAFADAVGLEPAACVMVGDSLHDLAAARTAGMAGVGVLTGVAGREALEPAGTVVLESIAELPDWVAERG